MLIVEPDTVGDDGGFTGVMAWGSISLSFFIRCITPVNDILALINQRSDKGASIRFWCLWHRHIDPDKEILCA